MASIPADHEEAADIIYDKIQILVVEEKKRRKHVHQFSPSIYRVPNILRDVESKCYSPRIVSIGPFHKDDPKMKEVVVHKVTYLLSLFRRLRSPRDQTMKECVNRVLAQIDHIKACYGGEMETDNDHEFAKMMVIDSCFILELVYRSNENEYEGHSFFDDNLLTLYAKHDLVLLENQIPFFVLENIFECTIRKFRPSASLTKLILSFLTEINPFGKELVLKYEGAHTNYDHILGLLQKCYQPSNAMLSEISKISNSGAKLSNAITSYPVAELSRAGVKFKPYVDANWQLAMEFKPSRVPCYIWSWGKPTFRMPLLQIEDYTESVLRNLIAYEQCSPAIPNYITSYAFAMERILDTKEDVLKVIDSEVVVNNLGSSKQASKMINSICKEVTVSKFSYTKEWGQLKTYYDGYWPKNVAWLRRTYFSTPWSFIALLAAFVLFGLTVAQTYYTIRPA